ncbi:MAG: acetyl-CoA hydrolase/transferase C-terminal domain-containing protein [Sulfitobacter sp.]|nr:acetyl-CoA hydrolase/transferase C-terminal domain-containing protein [Sulfitobacter sp.]
MERQAEADRIAQALFAATGGEIRLALPLGLGKPLTLVDALVRAAQQNGDLSLKIFTALTLEQPGLSSDMERRFLAPALDRLFGAYPGPLYARMLRDGTLPPNVEVNEFFLMAGRWLGVKAVQQNYISANYTHARDVLLRQQPNVLVQLVAERDGDFSLCSNTDISTDLFAFRTEGKADFQVAFEVHPELPFMEGAGAVVASDQVDHVLRGAPDFELFSAIRRPVEAPAHAIGLHVSRLIADGGTLQIGIGAIGDAVAHGLMLRDRGELAAIQRDCPFPADAGEDGPFDEGLYAVTEMLVGGLLSLFEAGIIRREVEGSAIHAGFFVEARDFYRRLRTMQDAKRAKIAMRPVSFTNALYGDEGAKRAARVKARFVNGAMQVNLLGDVMSDTLSGGQVVSGVGGQFNFVEQAFALEDARAIITLPSWRMDNGQPRSNIRWALDSVTVPRHMRDIVVTEYGIADLRGLPDAKVIAALLNITDSRFQKELLAKAKEAGKLPEDHEIPQAHRANLPGKVRDWIAAHRDELPAFPLGTDFDEEERILLPALGKLGDLSPTWQGKARLLIASVVAARHPQEQVAMARMGFEEDRSMTARALRGALRLAARDAR